jgi:hypothetical protein
MSQVGYTPLKLYRSSTTTNVPLAANLNFGELAINYTDGKLFYKDNAGVVQVLGTKGGVGSSTTTQVLYNNSGLVVGSANLTFDGTKLSTNTQGISNYGDYTGVSAPSYQEGRFWYDTTKKALTYYNDATNNAVHVGQETQVKVINNTGSTIAIGSPVYITGTSSGQPYPNIALAKADASATSAVIGLTNTAIASGAIGYVTSNGLVEGINTGSYTVGQVLYLSPYSAGQLMNTVPPTGLIVQVGVVSYVNASGSIYVKQTQPLILATTQGGTGLSSYTAGDLTYYASGTTFTKLAIGTAGQILTSSGTAPQWSTLTGVAVTTFSGGTTGLTPNTATSGAITLAGTLITTNGGTGLSSYTAGDLLYYASGSVLSKLGIGTSNYVLTSSGTAPQYVAQSTLAVGTATNLAGGAAGSLPYNTASATTTYLGIGSSGTVLTSSGSAPQWSTSLTLAGSITVAADSTFSSTGALLISKGTTAQQPGSPVVGMMRYNSSTNQFEGYSGSSPAWKSIGGSALSNDTSSSSNLYPVFASATTGTAENLYTSNAKYLYKPSTGELQASEMVATNGLFVNATSIAASYTIATGYNAQSVGPVTIASGQSVAISSGQRWLVY